MRAAAAALALLACARPAVHDPELLPEVKGFTASPVEKQPEFVRRVYTRGPARLSVTLAHDGGTPESFSQWVKMSQGYPPAALPGAGENGSGFYDCKGEGAAERCDLHAQLRTGYHLEIFTGGTATRADLDALVRGLPLARLATP